MMTDDEMRDLSDDDRAEREMTLGIIKGSIKHVAPTAWPAAVSVLLFFTMWPIALHGAILLPWWATIGVLAWITSRVAMRIIPAIRRLIIQEQKELGQRRAELREKFQEYQRTRKHPLTQKSFWTRWIYDAIPRSALVYWALQHGWPQWAAAATGLLSLTWQIIGTLVDRPHRRDQVTDILLKERGELPTPEI